MLKRMLGTWGCSIRQDLRQNSTLIASRVVPSVVEWTLITPLGLPALEMLGIMVHCSGFSHGQCLFFLDLCHFAVS